MSVSKEWKEKYASDYYRMTGEKYSRNLKTYVRRILCHNIRFMYWWRKNEEKETLISRGMLYRMSRKYGLEISHKAIIGEGLYLGHPYNITVAEGTVIGNNVNLHKGCTIGRTNRGNAGTPRIGNNVYMGINATIVGKVVIGDDVMIAPNSYINVDVPSHSVVLGNPATIHKKEYATEGYVNFLV